ncbi:DNA-binding transcriptional regulator, XRE-family HTH domain [Sphingopyxis sp. YR583]|uniref:helix-turn-helix transcriptional regulator n=1 Tax=Sphingopyxis sp. YR583 TaxID=1881047 RepID=UPI0008A79311|nr:helix-turn-helix transcriptional regulator [Sphingopyxis sp. YR583]SEH12790.1 DNA-binding transcriptional regulator, XRE-family HTH domain [Sphingopyxis sp. YR583]
MPATNKRSYARYTLAAATLLGQNVALERRNRKMTAQDLADRLGITRHTLRRIEQGDPKVELGLAFEACTLLGIALFGGDRGRIEQEIRTGARHLALLPQAARPRSAKGNDDDF